MKIKAIVLTSLLLAATVFTLQNCRKNDKKEHETKEQELSKLRSTPQIVFKKTVTTLEQAKQLVNDDRNGRMYPFVCTISANSALLDYWLIHTGNCTNESYTMHIDFIAWNTYHTDDGGRTHLNPNPVLSNVQLTINGRTVNATSVEYPYAPDDVPGAWLCVFEFPYTDVGLATQTTSFTPTITGTFTCTTNSNTGSLNYTPPGSQSINACTADGVVYPSTPNSGYCNFFFPWDIIPCGTQEWLTPGGTPPACVNIFYRLNGTTGSYTLKSFCGSGPCTVTDSPGYYEFKSRYVCSTVPGNTYYNGHFTINP
jgi:hypothetical protein